MIDRLVSSANNVQIHVQYLPCNLEINLSQIRSNVKALSCIKLFKWIMA